MTVPLTDREHDVLALIELWRHEHVRPGTDLEILLQYAELGVHMSAVLRRVAPLVDPGDVTQDGPAPCRDQGERWGGPRGQTKSGQRGDCDPAPESPA